MIVILAEKPSVAREIAAVVGATTRKDGYLEGRGYQVTWALGHLVRLSEPAEIDTAWGHPWRADQLPMLPSRWPLSVIDSSESQYRIVARLLRAAAVTEVICATDAGREGELIFRFIYERTGCSRPVKRLWVSSLTAKAIGDGLRQLKPARHYDGLAAAARARACADWLVGMNLSRAYQMGRGAPTSVGRVQTPTLAFLVRREQEIAAFVPTHFRQVRVQLSTPGGEAFEAKYVRMIDGSDGRAKESAVLPIPRPGLAPEHDADAIAERAKRGVASVARVESNTASALAPQLFDLTTLQREANRLWGWTAADTLQVAQGLYEAKLLSYPRTDSRYLSSDVALTLGRIVEVIAPPYRQWLREGAGREPLGKRFVNDAKVSDHHALIPTGTDPRSLSAGTQSWMLFDLVSRRLLQAWQEDHQVKRTDVYVRIEGAGVVDRYLAKGAVVVRAGWKALEIPARDAREEQPLPAKMIAATQLAVGEVRIVEDESRPPSPYTEADLLRALETAGTGLSDEQAEAMKERGLGTPATRAAIIETSLRRGYAERQGKALRATVAGTELVHSVHAHVTSAAMTAEMEQALRRIERGEGTAERFMAELKPFVTTCVREALKNGVAPRSARSVPWKSTSKSPPGSRRTVRRSSGTKGARS